MEQLKRARVLACLVEAKTLAEDHDVISHINEASVLLTAQSGAPTEGLGYGGAAPDTQLDKQVIDLGEELDLSEDDEISLDDPEPVVKKKVAKKKVAKKKVAKKKIEPKETFAELVEGLPVGPLELVGYPLSLLKVLDNGHRPKYLMGQKAEDFTSNDILGEAVKEGADKALLQQIIALSKGKGKAVENPITSFTPKTQAFISNAIEIIGVAGADLFNHMTSNGCNEQTLIDFRDIARAVKSGAA